MKPLLVFGLLALGLLAGAGVMWALQPPPPEPVVEYVEVPGESNNDGSCVDGFVRAIDFVHNSLEEIAAAGVAVYNTADESLTPLAEWFPDYESMKSIVDQAAAQECAK